MSPRIPRVVACLVLLAGALAPFARADENPVPVSVPVRVDYSAPPGCGDAGDFVIRLERRSSHVRIAAPGERAPLLIVRLVSAAGGGGGRAAANVRGRLSVQAVDGTFSEREVSGESCESVLNAVALMAALAVDPTVAASRAGAAEAEGTGGTSGAPGGAAPSSAAGTPSARPGEADAGTPKEEAKQADASPPEVASSAATETPSPPLGPPIDARPGWHLALGAGLGFEAFAMPQPVGTFTGFAELSRITPSLFSPSLRLGFEHADGGDQPADSGGGIHFVRNVADLELCPVRASFGPLRLFPCVRGEGGALDASGVGVAPSRSSTRPWVSTGILGRVRYVPFSPLFLDLGGGVLVSLVRDHFFFEPASTAFETPLFTAFVGGGIGLTIL